MDDIINPEVRIGTVPTERSSPLAEIVAELGRSEGVSLTRFLLLQGASWHEAEDAAQEAFAALCRTYPYGFAHWDKETKRCIAIDFSSDTVFEP